MNISERQKYCLKLIVEEFISSGQPVASNFLIEKAGLNMSSATLRAEMNHLEQEGYLQKAHTSSGRIPTTLGYEFYAQNHDRKEDEILEKVLKDIFAKRRASIDITLDEAANAISEMAGLTLVTSSSETTELMKSIQLTPLNEKSATIVIVTSTGRVESKLIEINKFIKIEDVRIAVRLFKERLVDTPLYELSRKIDTLTSILADNVKNYEDLMQTFATKVFDFHTKISSKVYGDTNIIKSDFLSKEEIVKLMMLLKSKSIFETIEDKLDEDEKVRIDIRPDNTSIISKRINTKTTSKDIAIVGSNRIDYAEAKFVIELLSNLLKG